MLNANQDASIETAYFALGCFWSPDARYGATPGVVSTRVGYAGGSTSNPRYHQLADHIETVRVRFRPDRIPYTELLNMFFKAHNSLRAPIKRQYSSALFPQNEQQLEAARQALVRQEKSLGEHPATELIPYATFYSAEDYHQKFHLRQHKHIFQLVEEPFSDYWALVDSTLAARLNGWVSGFGALDQLPAQLDALGAGEALKEALLALRAPRTQPSSQTASMT
jgi:methionine-S-sulfoxide reductase